MAEDAISVTRLPFPGITLGPHACSHAGLRASSARGRRARCPTTNYLANLVAGVSCLFWGSTRCSWAHAPRRSFARCCLVRASLPSRECVTKPPSAPPRPSTPSPLVRCLLSPRVPVAPSGASLVGEKDGRNR